MNAISDEVLEDVVRELNERATEMKTISAIAEDVLPSLQGAHEQLEKAYTELYIGEYSPKGDGEQWTSS